MLRVRDLLVKFSDAKSYSNNTCSKRFQFSMNIKYAPYTCIWFSAACEMCHCTRVTIRNVIKLMKVTSEKKTNKI